MIAPYVLGTLGLMSGIKFFWRPHRAVVREGRVEACPGDNQYDVCDPTLRITAPAGVGAYAPLSGIVAATGDNFVHIIGRHEPVIVMIDGIQPRVEEGQSVGPGQRIGTTLSQVAIGVWEIAPGEPFTMKTVDPASWLASRGMRVAAENTGSGELWCEGGRDITVPKSAGSACALRRPQPGKFGLLPVQVSIAR